MWWMWWRKEGKGREGLVGAVFLYNNFLSPFLVALDEKW